MARALPWLALVICALLSGCDRPGPLSAAARGRLLAGPPPPAWAAGLAGQPFAKGFAPTLACRGHLDAVRDAGGGVRELIGWAWDAANARPVDRLAVVDGAGRMVGFGEGGRRRLDVPVALPQVRSDHTGWQATAAVRGRWTYVVYGLDLSRRQACEVGKLKP